MKLCRLGYGTLFFREVVVSQLADDLVAALAFDPHQKFHRATFRAATKTFKYIVLRVYHEGSCFIVVERTAAFQRFSARPEQNMFRGDLNEVQVVGHRN
ncbi:hypothetical protein [Mucilaginibacter sp.]|uniref:hypothetical protein n=1 Tax=Mucilaginibacter sp. TaxID=1882438 RepID=UPI00326504C6